MLKKQKSIKIINLSKKETKSINQIPIDNLYAFKAPSLTIPIKQIFIFK